MAFKTCTFQKEDFLVSLQCILTGRESSNDSPFITQIVALNIPVALPTSGWTGDTQFVYNPAFLTEGDYIYEPSYAPGQMLDSATTCRIQLTEIIDGRGTFKCSSIPTIDLNVNIKRIKLLPYDGEPEPNPLYKLTQKDKEDIAALIVNMQAAEENDF